MTRFSGILLLVSIILFGSCDVEDLLKTSDPPEVSDIFCSNPDFTVQPLDTARFWITATNPQEGGLTYEWNVSSGEYVGSRQNEQLTWRAPIEGGIYTIRVTVSNADESVTKDREITVPSIQKPFVEITAPRENDYIVQNSTIAVNSFATSENGISLIEFYVNDSLHAQQSGNSSDTYSFNWLVQADAGPAELKIIAFARVTNMDGRDSIMVNVEGVIPGKRNE